MTAFIWMSPDTSDEQAPGQDSAGGPADESAATDLVATYSDEGADSACMAVKSGGATAALHADLPTVVLTWLSGQLLHGALAFSGFALAALLHRQHLQPHAMGLISL